MASKGFGLGGFGVGPFGSAPIEMQPLGYYLNLLTSEYNQAQSPLFRNWLSGVIQVFEDINDLFAQFITALDIDYAIGPQLDMLGQIIGAARQLSFQPSNGVSPILGDSDYRSLLKATIARNHWNGTQLGLWSVLQIIAPQIKVVLHDNQNMTATVFISGNLTSIMVDMITNGLIVPRPETVQYTYSFATLPAFGFDQNTAIISGFDTGNWT